MTAGRSRPGRRVSACNRWIVAFGGVALLWATAVVGLQAQSQLVWENTYGNGAVATPVTIDGTTVSVSGQDPFGVGSPGNFLVNYATRGAHSGYWETGVDATTSGQMLTISLTFGRPVQSLAFSLLDVDTNDQFHDSITVVGWNGNTPFVPTTVGIGAGVAEVAPGVYSGRFNVDNNAPGANADLRFDQLTDSVTFVYGPGPRASANPALGVIGFSDLTWTLPCVSTVLVATTPELRGAVGDACVTLILMTPGLYDLTVDGGGQLDIDQDKTLRNAGGGEVVIDAGGASRAIEIDGAILVELDGLTITGGANNNGAGIRSRATLTTIRNSLITGNSARNGGGLLHRGGAVLLENVTVSGNTTTRDGAGLDLRAGARLVHVTVANNSGRQGGGLRSRSNQVTLANTIVADNTSNTGGQHRGTINSLGGNLVEGGCAGCLGTDLTGDPGLLPLGSNGGNSRTHALGPASIAIDAALAALGLATDQRGEARPFGAGYDIGAYEALPAFAVSVSAAAAAVNHLPSNGTAYAEDFTATNTGPATSAFVLRAATSGSAVTVDSIRGPGVRFAAEPDSALTAALASGAAVTVTVFHTVLDVAAGTNDVVTLSAAAENQPAVLDDDVTGVTVVRPFLGMTKLATVAGDTIPGAAVTYQMTVTNLGSEAATQVELLDSLPTAVDFVIGSTSETLPAGISATLEFDDGTDAWSYTPVSGGCGAAAGLDGCVRAIRWTLNNPLPSTAPDNVAVFRFTAGIR